MKLLVPSFGRRKAIGMKTLRAVMGIATAVLMSVSTALGAEFQKGKEAYNRADYAMALQEWLPLAEQGNPNAQTGLGVMYDNGQGVAQDHAAALRWYLKAAEQGLAAAQHDLGILYDKGQGVAQDYVQAHKWLNLAAAREPPGESRFISVMLRDSLTSKMTPAQVAEAQRLAREWQEKHPAK